MKQFFPIAIICLVLLFVLTHCGNDPYSVPDDVPQDDLTSMPDWAKEAVWYQIMVERFRDGDPDNNPTLETIEGSWPHNKPESWQPTPWGHDWYAMEHWAEESGKDFYETVHMRRYGGDLQGVIDKMDHIEDLGITAIYFNPLNDSPSLHKYDPRSYHHIDVNFGPDPEGDMELIEQEDPADPDTWVWTSADSLFLEVIREAHDRDIRVIMDYSWNHTGSEFWAFQDVVENQEESDFKDWYNIYSFEDEEEGTEFSYQKWAGVPELPEFKIFDGPDEIPHAEPYEGNLHPELKRHIFAVTRRWLDPKGDGSLEGGVDGFRLDVAELLPMGFWRDYRKYVRSINPEAYMVAELWWDDWPEVLLDPTPWLEDYVFDAAMNYRWYMPSRSYFAGTEPRITSPSDYVDHLDSVHTELTDEQWRGSMNVTTTHDTPRLSTSLFNSGMYKHHANPRENEDYKIHRPDERTWDNVRQVYLKQFTFKGAPHIWMGEEFGMWGADDPDNRKPLIWPDLEFDDEVSHPHGARRPRDVVEADKELFEYIQTLANLRTENPVLIYGDLDYVLVDDQRDLLAYTRYDGIQKMLVVFNNARHHQSAAIELEGTALRDLLQDRSDIPVENGVARVDMRANSGRLFEVEME